jgi:hypothetical protein
MAKRGFLIEFVHPGGRSPDVHRIGNWAEDLLVAAESHGWGTVVDSNPPFDRVWALASSDRALGDLAQAIRRTLRHHNLLDDAMVTKIEASDLEQERGGRSTRDAGPRKRDDA